MHKFLRGTLIAAGLGLALSLPPGQSPWPGNPSTLAMAREGEAQPGALESAGWDVWGLKPGGEAEACFSPMALGFALGLAEAGAAPPTSDEVYRFFATDQAGFRKNLERTGRELAEARRSGLLNWASAVCVPKAMAVRPDYTTRVRLLGGEVLSADFSRPQKASQGINQWFLQKTRGAFRQLLTPADVPKAEVVSISALAFKPCWAHPFDPHLTQLRPFYPPGRPALSLPTMRSRGVFPCLLSELGESTDFSLLELNLHKVDWALDVVLPAPGVPLERLEKKLTEEQLRRSLEHLQERAVQVTLPRFRLQGRVELRPALSQLGLPTLFAPGANFAGMQAQASPQPLTRLIQQLDVEIKESACPARSSGCCPTHAAAASWGTAPTDEFLANRPFLFVIRQRRTGSFLFMGRYCGAPTGFSGKGVPGAKKSRETIRRNRK